MREYLEKKTNLRTIHDLDSEKKFSNRCAIFCKTEQTKNKLMTKKSKLQDSMINQKTFWFISAWNVAAKFPKIWIKEAWLKSTFFTLRIEKTVLLIIFSDWFELQIALSFTVLGPVLLIIYVKSKQNHFDFSRFSNSYLSVTKGSISSIKVSIESITHLE